MRLSEGKQLLFLISVPAAVVFEQISLVAAWGPAGLLSLLCLLSCYTVQPSSLYALSA